jgi:ubiquinone/menaquinone biosynthesis C-methylase UbiE
MTTSVQQIRQNVQAYDRLYRKYEYYHGEIFNEVEQGRLRAALSKALTMVRTAATPPHALDMGCGSGNLTRNLLALGANVTAADVSAKFLELIREQVPDRTRCSTIQLNGQDLSNVASDSFDLTATYSVLHHIPDYLAAVAEMARVTKPGGIVYIDHELTAAYWDPSPAYREFMDRTMPKYENGRRWQQFFNPSAYLRRLQRIPLQLRIWWNPRYVPEGDIHIWPDDHIDWDRVEAVLTNAGFEVVLKEDYLLYARWYDKDVYDRYSNQVSDMRVLAARKR